MKNKKIGLFLWIVIFLMFILANIINVVVDWFNYRFGVSFEEILFTIMSPMKGSDSNFLEDAINYVFPHIPGLILTTVILILLVYVLYVIKINITLEFWKIKISLDVYTLYRVLGLVLSTVLMVQALQYAVSSLQLDVYLRKKMERSTIYEEYYVKPTKEVLSLEGEPKNIIYIYMESMETTYASIEDGGAQDINYIPLLTQLATENTFFSHSDKLGGANVTTGASWTMGALFSITSGIPFSFPIDGNSMNQRENFASGVISLGDILEDYGYNQVFLCGSDSSFAGRNDYFVQHGNYEMHDYFYALNNGLIPEGYYVWWGFDDRYLYDIAKKEISELAQLDQPFNYTMLTVDTHPLDGYICPNCTDTYDHPLKNILQCADLQVYNFIEWCKQQPFYEDTVIIITGDHFRMDSSLVADKERYLYNCIINSDTIIEGNTSNRIFTTFDFFPTTLSAMGFTIKGNRLGLGTNLYSDTPTLAEELGLENFDAELGKYSDFYVKEFE